MNDALENLIPELAMVAATGSTNGIPRLGIAGAAGVVALIRAYGQGLAPALVKLSKALGHPKVIEAVGDETVEGALIRLAAERITELTPDPAARQRELLKLRGWRSNILDGDESEVVREIDAILAAHEAPR